MYMYNTSHVHVTQVFLHATSTLALLSLLSRYIYIHEVTALGVLCCFALFVCLALLASFFLPSHLSLKHVHKCSWNMHLRIYMHVHVP